jgi:lipoate-protein ligase A
MEEILPKSTWRLILSEPQPGPLNMAVDSAILKAVGRGEVRPTLRLYRWDPPCLSLGFSQSVADVDLSRLKQQGWDLVRRPTGGKAILHVDELTYAVIGPWEDPRLTGSLMDSYQRISRALIQALEALGLPVKVHQGRNLGANQEPVCFENPSDFEITVGGKKIIGSAQARKKEGVLQHGSLPLNGDLTRITRVLRYPSARDRREAAAALPGKAQTVSGVLDRAVSWNQAAEAFVEGFQAALQLNLVQEDLTDREQAAARELVKSRFGNPDWTQGAHLRRAICGSLKEKRSQLKPLLSRLQREFNIAVAELDYQDKWQDALIGCVTLSNDSAHTQRSLQKIIPWIERHFPHLTIIQDSIELI